MRQTLLLRPFRVSVRSGYDEVILEVTSRPFPLPIKAIRSLVAESLNVALTRDLLKSEFSNVLARVTVKSAYLSSIRFWFWIVLLALPSLVRMLIPKFNSSRHHVF